MVQRIPDQQQPPQSIPSHALRAPNNPRTNSRGISSHSPTPALQHSLTAAGVEGVQGDQGFLAEAREHETNRRVPPSLARAAAVDLLHSLDVDPPASQDRG